MFVCVCVCVCVCVHSRRKQHTARKKYQSHKKNTDMDARFCFLALDSVLSRGCLHVNKSIYSIQSALSPPHRLFLPPSLSPPFSLSLSPSLSPSLSLKELPLPSPHPLFSNTFFELSRAFPIPRPFEPLFMCACLLAGLFSRAFTTCSRALRHCYVPLSLSLSVSSWFASTAPNVPFSKNLRIPV